MTCAVRESGGGWRCAGVRWPREVPELGWSRGGDRRVSVLAYGAGLGFRAVGERHCVGARGNVCPLGAVVPGRSTGGRCAECARLDRAHSVAADTMADDPRAYRVYLAWFGPGMVKVGITGEERGAARLREQGAVAFSWLGRGPLMAARRTEEVLRAALGVPDRIPYAKKRAVRGQLPGPEERAGAVAELYARAAALEGRGWPESLERLPLEVVDQVGVFGLDRAPAAAADADADPAPGRSVRESAPAPVRAVRELVDGGVVAGRLVAAAGPDLHLAVADGGVVVLDTRLITGWDLTAVTRATGATEVTGSDVRVPLIDIGGGGVQGGLF
ncbi:DUF2797 domain-containing protein [Streptomyces rubiginosohelvolus]|uniref:DUF2797 domain-containing protein n=1 Tax=unclassified Streptomyces TaxID=2593676 RepID=UPI0019099598|nr:MULTISPECIES: DUF2797 domain-containing protein [unclassified Streptomyces]MBK3534035.1 DUF2797 domain-containing protein [Streptomyces sp. MBT72]MBK3540662.1 DUF2797 domain-containing protein [Streptomyces sp. MBT67]MBK3554163.1 DUF2797 domain-containing protein [Streptomyces sp. MBT61]MBK6033265.1 DUF2797 domain-containing protein [Streptomyces sp. MBT59]